jgi:hypothetical protein
VSSPDREVGQDPCDPDNSSGGARSVVSPKSSYGNFAGEWSEVPIIWHHCLEFFDKGSSLMEIKKLKKIDPSSLSFETV